MKPKLYGLISLILLALVRHLSFSFSFCLHCNQSCCCEFAQCPDTVFFQVESISLLLFYSTLIRLWYSISASLAARSSYMRSWRSLRMVRSLSPTWRRMSVWWDFFSMAALRACSSWARFYLSTSLSIVTLSLFLSHFASSFSFYLRRMSCSRFW